MSRARRRPLLRGPCRWSRRPPGRTDSGTAVVELVLLVVVLIVPLCYAVLCVFEVQRAAYATTSAVREAGRAFVTAPDGAAGEQRALAAAGLVLADHGLAVPAGRAGRALRLECSARPCLSPGESVTVRLTLRVRLPLVPAWGDAPASVRVHAQHVATVDEYREVRQ